MSASRHQSFGGLLQRRVRGVAATATVALAAVVLWLAPICAQASSDHYGTKRQLSDPLAASEGPGANRAHDQTTAGPSTAGDADCTQNPQCSCAQAFSQVDTLGLTLAVALGYWLLIVIMRWNRIARPTQELLSAQIRALRSEIDLLGSGAPLAKICELLTNAANLIDGGKLSRKTRAADLLFWSRGKELVGWTYVHEAELQLSAYQPPETVRVRLEAAERDLRGSNDIAAISLADDIHGTSFDNSTLPRQRALLAQALSVNYNREDSSFADLVTWQNKTSWLVFLGLLLIVILSGIEPQRAIFFLIGAVGGLLSRLSRSLERKDVPTDYGASWTTLFLSPVAGALGAWAGILVTGLAAHFKVLDSTFSTLWSCPLQETALAFALIFGFSERLLDTVLDKLIIQAGGDPGPGPAQRSPQGPSPTAAAPDAQLLPGARVDIPYTTKLTAPDFPAAVSWSLVQTNLPAGFNLQDDGTLTGTVSSTSAQAFYELTAAARSGGSQLTIRFRLPVIRG